MDQQIDFTEQCGQEYDRDQVSVEETKNDAALPSNSIIFKLLQHSKPNADAKILEIGFDDMKHLPFLFQKINRINYYGASISEVPLHEALSGDMLSTTEKWNQLLKIEEGGRMGFQDDFFDCCFSASSLYFWKNPARYFLEIYRILKPGGKFEIAFVEKNYGVDLPWTQVDFTFYEVDQVKDFFHQAGFVNIKVNKMTEERTDKNGSAITRPFVIISGRK